MGTNNGRAIFGVLAIVIGAAIYYCNSRINRLEESLQKQNQVLSSFITNIHNTIGGGPQSLSTPEADAAAFMKLGDIKGEATDNEHKEWIIIKEN